MRIPHAAIRGVAASAALAVGTLAGAPTASARSRAKKVEPVHRTAETHRRRNKKRTHKKRTHTKATHGTAVKRSGRKARCRLSVGFKHRVQHSVGCRSLPVGHGARYFKRKHRHHSSATPTATTTATTTTAPAAAAPVVAPTPAPAATPVAATQPAPNGVSGSWNLVFDDEFNGTAINTSVWNEHDGWTNQNSVTDHASNVSEGGGVATLTLASGNSGATIGTVQSVLAVGDFAEASVEFAGSGTTIYGWPAWWASGPGWPAAGENDIAEGLGTLTVNYHSPSGAHNQGTVQGDWAGAFHTYGIYRGAGYCNVYWDGQLVRRYTTDDNGQPQQLLFTTGAGNVMQYGAASQMHVDYVRVWAPS